MERFKDQLAKRRAAGIWHHNTCALSDVRPDTSHHERPQLLDKIQPCQCHREARRTDTSWLIDFSAQTAMANRVLQTPAMGRRSVHHLSAGMRSCRGRGCYGF